MDKGRTKSDDSFQSLKDNVEMGGGGLKLSTENGHIFTVSFLFGMERIGGSEQKNPMSSGSPTAHLSTHRTDTGCW